MTIQFASLSSIERQQAHEMWNDLMFAPTQTDLDSTRAQFLLASAPVRGAIVRASIALQTHEQRPLQEENPFD